MEADRTEDLILAHQLADLAAEIALDYFDRGVTATSKADGSPVTEADIDVERRLVEVIATVRPADGVTGEEGSCRVVSNRRWIFDPIDGTVNFVGGSPHWGTHVALEEDGEIVLGIITRPVLGRRWWATRGGGARCSEAGPSDISRELRVSTRASLAEARVTLWPPSPGPLLVALQQNAVWVEPDFTIVDQLLDGDLDAIVAGSGGEWDHAPVVVLTEEAGGRFCDVSGGRRLDTGGGVYTNGLIHDELIALLHTVGLGTEAAVEGGVEEIP